MSRPPYTVGQAVWVFSFGRWYTGSVERIGRTRTHVRFRTGSGAERVMAFPATRISATDPAAAVTAAGGECEHRSVEVVSARSGRFRCMDCGVPLARRVVRGDYVYYFNPADNA